MQNFNLESLGLVEIGNPGLIEINGGDVSVSPWWGIASAAIEVAVRVMDAYANAYIKYSAETGGKYVIHHAY
jgi:hypothetical protein